MTKRRIIAGVAALLVVAGVATGVSLATNGNGKSDAASSSGVEPSGLPSAAGASSKPIYLDPSYSPAERAVDLVSRMTPQQRAQQLNSSQAPAIEKLGVAAYGWWNEAAHGVAREGTVDGANPPDLTNTTSYPVDLSLGSTWDPQLMYDEATLISDEAREVVRDNSLDLSFYSPTVNLSRDPRWGRNDETFSEDPVLTAAMASQYVNGMEGKDAEGKPLPDSGGYLKTLTTLKHFAANNSEVNRRDGSSDMDERTLREYYTAQFRDIIERTQPAAIMSSYNEVNGVPASANVDLIDTLARETFGFQGYFTSDCDGVYEMQAGHSWVPSNTSSPVDEVTRTAYANSAGEDLNCDQGYHDDDNYGTTIGKAIERRVQTLTDVYNENDVDVSAVRLFTARIATGEFDAGASVPWVAKARAAVAKGTWKNDDGNKAVTQTKDRLAMASRVAAEAIVLLKNDAVGKNPLLPLRIPKSGAYKVAVVGQYAQSMYLGGYSSKQGAAGVANQVNDYQGLKSAIQAVDKDATVDYVTDVTPALAGYDVVVVCAGTDRDTASEDNDRLSLALPNQQADLISKAVAANPHTIVYLETVGTVDVRPFVKQVPALLWSSYNGERAGEALADVVTGKVNPGGHLPFTWYADQDQLPDTTDYAIRPGDGKHGRTYMYFNGDVTFPFGYGLSYTSFAVSNGKADVASATADGTVHVTADVKNTGTAAGSTVVQLYVATPDSPAALQRPVKRLAGFTKVSLQPGETKHVDLTVAIPDLAFWDDATSRYVVDNGRYDFQIATSATDVRQHLPVQVSGTLPSTPTVVSFKPVADGDAAKGVAQRVLFPADVKIDPQLTVSTLDAQLFGYVTKGQGKPLPDGMTATYTSNRPGVVRVGADGAIQTVSKGVATISAKVTYQGKSVAGSFVVGVQATG